MDAADVLFDLNDATNDYGIVIDCNANGTIATALEFTTAGGASAAFTTAIDVSDAGISTGLKLGASDIVSTGGGKINYDNFDMDDATGNTTIGGTLGVTGATTLSSTLALTGALTSQGAIIIDADAAEAFLIRENGDAADVVTVDTTQDAGDTTFKVSSKTTTGIAAHLDTDTTTGQGLLIDADAVTSGDALLISVASGTMTSAGAAISVIDSSNSDREIFAVRDDGSVYTYGTAEGTTGFELGLGDLVITDGDLTVSGGEVSITDGVTTSGSGLGITSSMTTAGAGAGAAGALVVTAASATTGTVVAVTADAITTGDMLFLDAGGGTMTAGSGFFINCNDDNASKFSVSSDGRTVIAGTAAGTSALTLTAGDLTITDTDTTTITSVDGTGNIVEIVSGGAIGAGKGVLEIDAAGTWNATGTGLLISIDGITATNNPYAMRINAAGKDAGGFYIDADGATDSVCHIHGGGNVANNMALLELTWDGTPANAGSNMLRVDGSGGTNTAKPVLVEVYDDSVSTGLSVTASPTANDVAIFAGGGALTDGNAVVAISNSGNLAAGGINLEVVMGGTPNADARAFEIDAQKDARAVYIDTDAATNDAVVINADGNLGAGKFALLVDIGGTVGTGGGALKLDATGTFGGDERVMEIDVAGKTATALWIDTDVTGADGVLINGGGALTNGNAVLALTNDGNLATGGNVFSIDVGGTPHAAAIAFELTSAKDCQAMVIATSAATDSGVEITGAGALGADKAVVEIASGASACNADSNSLRVTQTAADGANVPLAILQADVSEPLVLYESTEGSGSAVDLTNTTPAAVAGSVLISVNGTDYRMPVYAAAGWS